MGVRNYLIEGGSGTGKTTVAEELQRRGYHVVHGDRQLAYCGDPVTGESLDAPVSGDPAHNVMWRYERWIWPVDAVRSLAADLEHSFTFFCGHSSNFHRFIDLFDKVFVLEVDCDTLNRRLAARPADEFGGRPEEREFIVWLHASKQGLPENAVHIDATTSVDVVVDAILSAITDGRVR